ncbi:prophage lysin [Limosilactobacillus gastricus PS3]|uniref:Lysozyme n=1 Tax=Limosilactobacillus gastricus PS3 TaxID=1144300 RepID=H4GJ96_9LACO|nr:prophage lysin [Limosilactobacillus gastricus PS3]
MQGGIQTGDYGVDVSSFQGTDLSGYAANGAKYAIVKVTEGTGYINYNASGQIASAQANNLYTMAYHFATFSNDSYAAVNQANFAVQQAQAAGLPAGSYLCLDWESGDGNYIYGNTEANTQAILAFMRTVQAAGYKTMLYSGASAFRNNVNISEVLAEFPNSLWVASYPTTSAQWQADMNYFPSMNGVAIWQFADNWAGFGVDGNIAVTNVN